MTRPARIQLRRTKSWKLPADTVNVARPGRWGNPYAVELYGREVAIRLFRSTVHGIWDPSSVSKDLVAQAYVAHQGFLKKFSGHPAEAARVQLKGRNLACWCKDTDACHADVLLEVANE